MEQASNQTETRQSVKQIFSNNLFLLRYMMKYSPFYVIFTCLYYAFHSVVVFLEHTIAIKLITDAIQYGEPFSKVLTYIIIITLLISTSMLLGRLYYHIVQVKGRERLLKKLRTELYQKATSTDLACYDNPEYYNDFVLSINEVRNRVNNMIDYLSVLSSTVASIFVITGFFLILDKVGLIFVVISLFSSLYVNFVINKYRFKMRLELNTKERKRKYINRVFYLVDYAKEIRLNQVSNKLNKEFEQSNKEIRGIVDHYSKKMVWLSFINNFVCKTFVLDGLYMLYIAFMTIVKQAFSYGSALALVNSSWNLNQNIQNLTRLAADFQENSLYIDRIRQFLSYDNRIKDAEQPIDVSKKPATIELKNVSFSYSEKDEPILKDISLTIEPYEKIAIVGYNGAGKTTLMKLLMRLYDVSNGNILVGGNDIKNYKLEDYRQSYGTVFQDYQLFAASVAENVLMNPYREEHKDKVIQSLQQSGFASKLEELDNGIETQLTREFNDKGTNLSGGEAQKVAIARVFAKECPYIILDEPSSALDPISEYHMNHYMLQAANQKTVIFISHRLSTTRMADRIIMLERGKIIEQGTHDELMQQNGKYAEMFNLQAEKYRAVSGLV